MPTTFSRRSILRTFAGTALAAPLGRLLMGSPARAADATPPLRLITLFTPHGMLPQYWLPRGTETEFSIDFADHILQPVKAYQSRMIFLDGIDYQVLYENSSVGHEGSRVTFLTGSKAVTDAGGEQYAASASIDQAVAAQVGAATRFRSLVLNIWEGSVDNQNLYNSISFTSTGARVPYEVNPASLYARLFADFVDPSNSAAAAASLARKKSLLDYQIKDVTRLQARLVGTERAKLDQHLEALRDIERRLNSMASASCSKPAAPTAYTKYQITDLELMPALSKLHLDLVARAFACDLTRVVSLFYPSPEMPWLGLTEDVHNKVVHLVDETAEPTRTEIHAKYLKVQRWYSEQVAYLLDRLAEIPEGSGSVLDNTVILWGNELGNPSVHTNLAVPTVVIGDAQKRFRTGRYVRLRPGVDDPAAEGNWSNFGDKLKGAVPHNRLLTSIANAFGIAGNTFGHPDYPGTLTQLT